MQNIPCFRLLIGFLVCACCLNWIQAIDQEAPPFESSNRPSSQGLTPEEIPAFTTQINELEAMWRLDAAVAEEKKQKLDETRAAPPQQVNTPVKISEQNSSSRPVVPEQNLNARPVAPAQNLSPPTTPSAVPVAPIVPVAPVTPTAPTGAVQVTLTPAAQQPAVQSPTPVTPSTPASAPAVAPATIATPPKTILINFTNVGMIELIRFISRVSNKNFIFDENDLQFNVTIVSEEPTTIENVMAALLQELRIHGLSLLEQGNNIIIHQAPGVNSISKVVVQGSTENHYDADIVTQLFRLNTLDADNVATLIRPLVSDKAFVEVLKETNYLVVTDLVANLEKVAQLIKSIDKPNSGSVIGQYVVRNSVVDVLIEHARSVMTPLSIGQTLIFVPHYASSSIFIVSSPFLVARSMTIMQYLDQRQGMTRIFDEEISPLPRLEGEWRLDAYGNWVFYPSLASAGGTSGSNPPEGSWVIDAQGNWHFVPGKGAGGAAAGAPEGNWVLDKNGNWVFQLAQGGAISPSKQRFPSQSTAELPLGHIERTQFSIYKLHYRKGDEIQEALSRIGQSLELASAENNVDLIAAINSIQWLEASNSLILTGTGESVSKIKEFISEIDLPLRQVFIEMLILLTTIDDSLNYSVNFEADLKQPGVFGAESFLSQAAPTPLTLAMQQASNVPTLTSPDPGVLARTVGFNLGIVGQHLTYGGLNFNTIGALIRALRDKINVNVVMNPKILTEDNYPAEIFVGLNTQFPTQAIVNDQGVILTQNFEYRNVGTYLSVTPLIGDNDVVTLLIEQDVSSLAPNVIGTAPGSITTRLNTTKTKVHLPNKYFLILSGMIQDTDTRERVQVPCLGGIPFLGAAFSDKRVTDSKSNLMIFIRPQIVDTIEDIQTLTRHQQDVFILKCREKAGWKYEAEEALDFLNLKGAFDCDGCPDACGDDF